MKSFNEVTTVTEEIINEAPKPNEAAIKKIQNFAKKNFEFKDEVEIDGRAVTITKKKNDVLVEYGMDVMSALARIKGVQKMRFHKNTITLFTI